MPFVHSAPSEFGELYCTKQLISRFICMQSGYVKLMQRMLNDKKDLYTYNNIDEEFHQWTLIVLTEARHSWFSK